MLRQRHLWILALSVCSVLSLRSTAAEPQRQHGRLHAALHELREARNELRTSRGNFGGHKDAALRAIDDAATSIKAMLRIRDDDIRGLNRNPDFYKRHRDYPRIRQALDDLRDARNELRGNKEFVGNLRERALRDIDLAIDHLQVILRSVRG